MYVYDLKTKKIISSKAKYYFSDIWIRGAWNHFTTQWHDRIENYIYNELYANEYDIYGWKNGTFSFSFFANRDWKSMYIHISQLEGKEDLKKEVRKLAKLSSGKKYLVIEDKKATGLRSFVTEMWR